MGFFSDFFKTKTFYYADLPVGERLFMIILEYVFPVLQPEGFVMTERPLVIKRTRGIFEHKINFKKNKWNRTGEMASIETYLTVEIKEYKKWHKRTYGTDPRVNSEIVSVNSLRDSPGMSNWTGFLDFAEIDNVELTDVLKEYFKAHAIPFMAKYDNVVNVIEILKKRGQREFPLAVDLALITENLDMAKSLITVFDETTKNDEVSETTHAEMKLRRDYINSRRTGPFEGKTTA